MTVHHVEVMPDDYVYLDWGDGETFAAISIDDEVQMTVTPMPIEGGEVRNIKIDLTNGVLSGKIDRDHKPEIGPHKKYLILPIYDADPGMIFDILANAADQIEQQLPDDPRAKHHVGNIRRVMAELGWYQEDVPGDDGQMVDIFRITAFVTERDPRPDVEEGVVND